MKQQRLSRSPAGKADRTPRATTTDQRAQLMEGVGRQIDEIYLQLDDQLTRMAQIQLQFDELRSRIRRLN